METPQLQAISSYKRSYLTAEQNDAIDAAIGRDPDEADPWGPDDEDGCPGKEPGTFLHQVLQESPNVYVNTVPCKTHTKSLPIFSCGAADIRQLKRCTDVQMI